jgi:predicted dehydrogenase
MKIGIVGLGLWTQSIIRSLPNTENHLCVLTKREDAIDILPPDTCIYRSYEDLMESDVSHIIIANETSKHQYALRRIRAELPKIPILIEKPFATSVSEANEYINKYGMDEKL